jgi:Transposase DDE domain
MIVRIAQRCSHRTTQVQRQAHSLQQEITKVMRGFGRQCRGHGHVFVKVVRHTEQQLLELGQPIAALGQQAQQLLTQATALSDATRKRVAEAFDVAMHSHTHIRKQSTQLPQGKKLRHCKLVNAYDLTIAPILKGKSNCPAQFGRKPGIASEPATGFIFATRVPEGNPNDASYVLPLLDKVQSALERVQTTPKLRLHSVAGDLGVNDAALRQALHARGILTVGIPQSVKPIAPNPSAQEVGAILNEAGLRRKRTPYQVQLACACGSSRPVVESHIASLLSRGAGQVRYKGHPGAVRQQGMTVMAHNGATLVRIRQQQLSKRAQKFRRLLGLRHRKTKEINNPKN